MFGSSATVWNQVVRPFAALQDQMHDKWGFEKLVTMQEPVVAARWGEVMQELNDAEDAKDQPRLITAVQTAISGLHVMDENATAAGHDAPGMYSVTAHLEADADAPAYQVMIVQEHSQIRSTQQKHPGAIVITAREAALAWRAQASVVPMGEVRELFPHSEITDIRPKTNWAHGDNFELTEAP